MMVPGGKKPAAQVWDAPGCAPVALRPEELDEQPGVFPGSSVRSGLSVHFEYAPKSNR